MSDETARTLRSLVDVSVDRLKNIGPKRTASLSEMGITSIFDLLTTYPRRYIDRTKQADLTDVRIGDEVAIFGEVQSVRSGRTKQGRPMVSLKVHDGTALKMA